VYGPNENHKGKMASVVWHAFYQIQNSGRLKLFQSHKAGIQNGHQMRDFVYVKDVCQVCFWLMTTRKKPAIYNLGSGKARTFIDLATSTFAAMNRTQTIQFIPTPEDIRDSYQYFTQADMRKLASAGYPYPFTTLEDGIAEYVNQYLLQGKFL
jgi:ADP-L-glycero-D-manno-heptose 6-epimerase